MAVYKVTVATGTSEYSGTNNYVYLTLIGEAGQSERTVLDNPGLDLCRGAVDEYEIPSPVLLGRLQFVRLEKRRYWVEDNWFCRSVSVRTPGGDTHSFPCYRWLVGDVTIELREGQAKKLCDDSLPEFLAHRKRELQERQQIYKWLAWEPDIPKCIDAKTEKELPQDVRFDNEKQGDFVGSLHYALLELSLKKLVINFGKSWDTLEDFKRIFWKLKSPVAEYVMAHWKEDWFFGFQFLNGSNPGMIQQCRKLPRNFPVSADMVQASLLAGTTLSKEMKAGNIYLMDYAILDGLPANVIRGKQQHLAAPLCLLYEHPDKGLLPLAIQLGQTPGSSTPVFLPSDPPLAWLLSKIWVRNSDFQIFQILTHLLRTHLVMEVFCVATLRQLPAVHPVYKLLIPHLRYTLEINTRARSQLISNNGIFKRVSSTGGSALLLLSQREFKILSYESLQPRLDFQRRGVTKLRDYFYREDSLMLWDTIQSYVSGLVSLYYSSDAEVTQDSELQLWIRDITEEGFRDVPQFGLSSELRSRKELVTLLSVVIFTASVQHAAANNGQFDWCAWVPNTPCTMRLPPPTCKGSVTMEMIMETLPDISQSCVEMAITWHLGRAQPDAIPLGRHTEEYFTEEAAQAEIRKFNETLKEIEQKIEERNQSLELKYEYLKPSRIENSITI
ncbi:polyunsaturated fatty acid 5-lipoxygenase-like isoform X4 [Polyodon spathula]|nr:polyunsaturated fatty acid 5-lipoxygenase-like isoform X4 [Polyodon spathula]XP_041094246.1 polyunsaturated fatty acid 5-lipoxygenase-like isoform X4 [Polyodon spathula]XP_041094247.1 polyunsaturated fatty acid 5-lipoxygenase-like isoform X4 [Polyodon spathula]XP_041094248.1 polyunsaturated fatty acid 5-lipoxygenase-like isoform X4 [Polyodon spathula]